MIQPENTQTRKDEVRFRTSDIRRIVGKFLASNVLKTWNEDFIDESTGEVVTIERNEILFERGSYIDDDLAQQINFSIQAEEIKDVEVSNQRRLAAPNQRTGLYPFKVSARIGTKRRTFILQAQDAAKAIEVATDYIELNFRNSFDITDIKLMDNVVILNDRLRKSVETKEGANEEGAEPDNGEETRDDTKYYKVEAEVAISTENEEEPEKEALRLHCTHERRRYRESGYNSVDKRQGKGAHRTRRGRTQGNRPFHPFGFAIRLQRHCR